MQAHPLSLQRDHSTLPEVDTSLFTNPDHGRCQWKLTHSPSNGTIHRSRKPTPCLTLLSSWKVRYRNHLKVAGLLAGLHVAHGPSNPTLSSHHHSVGPLEGLGPHDMGPSVTFPDAMDWLTPAASDVDAAYSEGPTPYEYEGTAAFTRDDPSLFALARSEGGSTRTTMSPYTPPNGNPLLPSQFNNIFSDPCQMNMKIMTDPTQ